MEVDTVVVSSSPFFIGSQSEWFWAMVQAFIVAASLFFIAWQVQIQGHSNVLASLNGFHERWTAPEAVLARGSTCERWSSTAPAFGNSEETVCSFFETLGLYVEKRVISREMAWEMYSYYVENYWALLKDGIAGLRHKNGDNTLYCHFGKLNDSMRDYGLRRGVTPADFSDERINRFREFELERVAELKSLQQREGS
ncbi:MAG TPA: hypothetical protein VFT45_06950 [Longimicrobium sp.]|nr:hypothetical protein [Longimicrobium sp.]